MILGRRSGSDSDKDDLCLINLVADTCDIPPDLAADAITAILSTIANALASNRDVDITGFGTFRVYPAPTLTRPIVVPWTATSHPPRNRPGRRLVDWIPVYTGAWPRLHTRSGIDTYFRAIENHRRRRDKYQDFDDSLLI